MNAPHDPTKGTNIVPVDPPKLPAMKKPLNEWKAFRELEKDADLVLGWYEEIEGHGKALWAKDVYKGDGDLPEKYELELDDEGLETVARCKEVIELLDPESN